MATLSKTVCSPWSNPLPITGELTNITFPASTRHPVATQCSKGLTTNKENLIYTYWLQQSELMSFLSFGFIRSNAFWQGPV